MYIHIHMVLYNTYTSILKFTFNDSTYKYIHTTYFPISIIGNQYTIQLAETSSNNKIMLNNVVIYIEFKLP